MRTLRTLSLLAKSMPAIASMHPASMRMTSMMAASYLKPQGVLYTSQFSSSSSSSSSTSHSHPHSSAHKPNSTSPPRLFTKSMMDKKLKDEGKVAEAYASTKGLWGGAAHTTAGDLVAAKNIKPLTCKADTVVFDAVKTMVKHNVGSLVVVDERERPIGIATSKDYMERVIVMNRHSNSTLVKDIMSTKSLVWVTPTATLQYCMDLMSAMHVTHIPIIENEKLKGIISIGDVVRELVKNIHAEQNAINEYISGSSY
mmetsp:Transcript_12782/g.21901  ORF Transcript_12782/g.21901 Transcript_12782/m.21901 type:complete len:256 (+) Transcript_12782:395-1162(+)